MSGMLDAEIERLSADLEQEITLRDALKKSAQEVEVSVLGLEKKLLGDNEDSENEWQLRYQQQFNMNEQLEKQLASMKDKMKELQRLDEGKTDCNNPSKMNDADLRKMLQKLEREKRSLEGQLKDLEWKLNSESQELFKLTEEKKKYKLELNQAENIMDGVRVRSRSALNLMSPIPGVKFSGWKSTTQGLKEREYGIPDNRRVLDPRKGPVKKTVAVKMLPKLNTASSFDSSVIPHKTAKSKKRHRKTRSSENPVKQEPESDCTNDTV